MKKYICKIGVLLCAFLIFSVKEDAATLKDAGTCGTNVKWYLYDDGNMVIEGNGEMLDYGYVSSQKFSGTMKIPLPWASYKDNIKTVSIGEGVLSVGDYAFSDCTNLEDVWISSTVIEIGDYAFEKCSALKKIIIPDNVTTLGKYVLQECICLKDAYISGQITVADYLFKGCSALQEVAIPKKMQTISEGMFYDCTALTSVRVDETVTTVGKKSFLWL